MSNNQIRLEAQVDTFTAKIYVAGDLAIIEHACREHCLRVGLCVTVRPVSYIYTGGQEQGAEVGLINYGRFPSSREQIEEKAVALARELIVAACQMSASVVMEHRTIWLSRRPQEAA